MRLQVMTGVAAMLLAGCGPAPNSADSVGGGAKTVTLAEYEQLHDGMSYVQAAKVIGFAGTEQSSSAVGGTRTVMYAWANNDGSNMNAMFQGDRLITKAQFGLR